MVLRVPFYALMPLSPLLQISHTRRFASRQCAVPGQLVFGAKQSGSTAFADFYDGLLDSVSLWGRVLPLVDVKSFGNHAPEFNAPGLLARWLFDEGKGLLTRSAVNLLGTSGAGTNNNGWSVVAGHIIPASDTATSEAVWAPSLASAFPTYRDFAGRRVLVELNGTDAMLRPLRFVITSLPQHGSLCIPSTTASTDVRDCVSSRRCAFPLRKPNSVAWSCCACRLPARC